MPHPDYTPISETIEFFAGDHVFGYVFMPSAAAFDLVHRLEDIPATLNVLTATVAAHVRHVLDSTYNSEHDQPDQWTRDLIRLIHTGDEEQRRQIGRGYMAYVWAVSIATAPGGLEQLRRMHQTALAVGGHTDGGR